MKRKKRGMILIVFLLGIFGASLVACFLFFSISHVLKEASGMRLNRATANVSGFSEEVGTNLVGEEKELEAPVLSEEQQRKTEHSKISETEFSFSAIGDSERYKSPNRYQENVLQTWERVKILQDNLIFFTGDIIAADGEIQEIRRRIKHVKEKFEELFPKKNFHVVFGNHDVECGTPCLDLWQEIFFGKRYDENEERIAYHSFDYSNTHFVILSSSYPGDNAIDSKQMGWLDEDLGNSNKENKIVFVHVPPVTFFKESAKECHDMSCSEPSRTTLLQILKRHSVDLVVSGHEDAFDHKVVDGMDFVLSGNADGGDPRYEGVMYGQNFTRFYVDGTNISMEVIDLRRGVVREIKIK